MGRSVVKQTKARELKRFLGTGLHIIENEIPSNYAENPIYCPFMLDESCEGAKDPEYAIRCRSETFDYIKCELYAFLENIKNKSPERLPVSDPLVDTVIMSAEDIVNDHSRRSHHRRNHRSIVDDSIHDRVAEGEDDRKFGYFRKSLGSVEW